MKKLIVILMLLLGVNIYAQDVFVEFRNDISNEYCEWGNWYIVITNNTGFHQQINWRCIDIYGRYLDGSIYLYSGNQTWIGPNYGWTWEDGETFQYSVSRGYPRQVSFRATPDTQIGKPCKHTEYNWIQTCSERGKCSGFKKSNRDPYKCANCGHSYKDHK